MSGRKALLILCMLLGSAFAFAAQSAPAATKIYICSLGGGSKDFGAGDSHCSKGHVTPGTGEYGHVETKIGGVTTVVTNNVKTGSEKETTKLKSTQFGVTLELQSTTVSGSGSLGNVEEGGEQFASGSGSMTFEGATVTAPEGKGCVVKGGKFAFESLAVSTKGLTGEMKMKPTEGETLGSYTIEGCSIPALNHAYAVKGTVTGSLSGSTLTFNHAILTGVGSLFCSSSKCGIQGSYTFKDLNGSGAGYT